MGPTHKWLIRLAILAAPKPLSMLTTETPAEQLLSMPSRAAIPPKLAPYPTLVGTAMTGTLTSPATTLGNAPSIPATTEQPMESGDADVVNPLDGVAHQFGRQRCLFGDGLIRRAG